MRATAREDSELRKPPLRRSNLRSVARRHCLYVRINVFPESTGYGATIVFEGEETSREVVTLYKWVRVPPITYSYLYEIRQSYNPKENN